MAKLKPKKYGEKQQIEGTMKNYDMSQMTTEQLFALLNEEK